MDDANEEHNTSYHVTPAPGDMPVGDARATLMHPFHVPAGSTNTQIGTVVFFQATSPCQDALNAGLTG